MGTTTALPPNDHPCGGLDRLRAKILVRSSRGGDSERTRRSPRRRRMRGRADAVGGRHPVERHSGCGGGGLNIHGELLEEKLIVDVVEGGKQHRSLDEGP
jgi:hypothetical protein